MFTRLSSLGLLTLFACAQDLPVNGPEVPELEAFDRFGQQLVRDSGGPGLSLAIVRGGKLVFARGYGYSRVESREPVLPSTLFRANSVSKWITNAAIQELIKDGVLSTDDLAFAKWLPDTLPAEPDDRLNTVRLWHLFAHGVPWTRERCGFDLAARELGAPVPTPPQMMVHYFTRGQLAGPVGQTYGYHNTNHVVLARVIERATGQGYEEFIQKRMLEPLGIRRMRIGNTRRPDLSSHESYVYLLPDNPMGSVGLPQASGVEPLSHQLCMNEMQDANGGWLASAPDLAHLAANYEAGEYRVSQPGRWVHIRGSHNGGGVGGWGLSIAMSFGPGNGLAFFINGADGTTEWAKSVENVLLWCGTELRRLVRETTVWPDIDLREQIDTPLREALTMRLGVDSLSWISSEESLERTVEVQAAEGEAWHLISSALWLEVSQWSGTGPATIRLRANRNGLWDGRYYGTLAIENATKHSHHHTVPLSFEVTGSQSLPAVAIRTQTVPLLDRDQQLNVQFSAEGGRAPYRWRLIEELPAGFSFNAAEARLTGRSATDLAREITIEVTDSTGAKAIRRWMLAVNTPLQKALHRASLIVAPAFPAQNACATSHMDRVPSTQAQLTAALLAAGGTHWGDELIYEWTGPDGAVRSRMRYNLPYHLAGNANARCTLSAVFALSGVPAAARRGQWTIRALYNRNVVASRTFTVE
ncbi:MAG: serine hydrolase [Bryobacteraceae bacterium]|nr:serine hydrolase [Bryobacteraceae bacterium]